jgi:RHS repeat-associated protein
MLLVGRTFDLNYRYGFNGKEHDSDPYGQGNMYDYGFRIYNPRLGKFLSVDPLTKSYPWYTPYLFAGNKPIMCIDLDGLEEALSTYTSVIGKTIVLPSDATVYLNKANAQRLVNANNEPANITAERANELFPDGTLAAFTWGGLIYYAVYTHYSSGETIFNGYYNDETGTYWTDNAPLTVLSVQSLYDENKTSGFPRPQETTEEIDAIEVADLTIGAYDSYIHDHKTYIKKNGERAPIYKQNGKVRSARAAKFAKISKSVSRVSVVVGAISTVGDWGKVIEQSKEGNVKPKTAVDALVGTLGTTAGVALLMGSNPIGWGIIATGATVYGVARLVEKVVNKYGKNESD